MYYTGIGSRKTPTDIQCLMAWIGKKLQSKGFTLRSGAADGADKAFEHLVTGNKEIYLPWQGFNGHNSGFFGTSLQAMDMASDLHPAWSNLSEGAKKLMARNCHQVLGIDLKTPSKFVVCWTPDGCESHSTRTSKTGGTGLAISLASINHIPIYNLANSNRLLDLLKEQL